MGKILDDGLQAMGFSPRKHRVCGFEKTFWCKGPYWFADHGTNSYEIVAYLPVICQKRFTTRRRREELADREILSKLESWLQSPDF